MTCVSVKPGRHKTIFRIQHELREAVINAPEKQASHVVDAVPKRHPPISLIVSKKETKAKNYDCLLASSRLLKPSKRTLTSR